MISNKEENNLTFSLTGFNDKPELVQEEIIIIDDVEIEKETETFAFNNDSSKIIFDTITKAQKLFSDGATLEEINREIGEADLTLPNYISKWKDNGKKYGLGYVFSDHSAGYLFQDASIISASSDRCHYEYIDASCHPNLVCYHKKSIPEFLRKKTRLFQKHLEFMDENLAGSTISTFQNKTQAELSSPSITEDTIPLNSEQPKVQYISKLLRSTHARIFRVSKGYIQMSFTHISTKYIFADNGRAIFRFSSGQNFSSFRLVDVLAQSGTVITQGSSNVEYSQVLKIIEILKASSKHLD